MPQKSNMLARLVRARPRALAAVRAMPRFYADKPPPVDPEELEAKLAANPYAAKYAAKLEASCDRAHGTAAPLTVAAAAGGEAGGVRAARGHGAGP